MPQTEDLLGCPKLDCPKLLVWPKAGLPNAELGAFPVATEFGAAQGDWRLPMAEVPPNAGVLGTPNEDWPKVDFCVGVLVEGCPKAGVCAVALFEPPNVLPKAGVVGRGCVGVAAGCVETCCVFCSLIARGPPAATMSGYVKLCRTASL